MKTIHEAVQVTKQVVEVSNEGLDSFLGKSIAVQTPNFLFSGLLVGVNTTCIKLENPEQVFETGDLLAKTWKDAQKLPAPWYLQTSAIIGFGPGK